MASLRRMPCRSRFPPRANRLLFRRALGRRPHLDAHETRDGSQPVAPITPAGDNTELDLAAQPDGATARRPREALLRITARRAEVLRDLADGYSGREIAARIGLTHSGLRSHVEALKEITGCSSTRELGRWWREHRASWLAQMSEQAGVARMPEDVEPPP